MVNKDGVIEKTNHAGFKYADDVYVMTSYEQDLQKKNCCIRGCIK